MLEQKIMELDNPYSTNHLSFDYSNTDFIKQLIRHRHELEAQGLNYMRVLCMDLDNAINGCEWSKRQKEILDMYKLGYTENQIGEALCGVSQQAIYKSLRLICIKISKFLRD